jgi:Raf kinase inhibitor-like YbhB/YbcL family protein
MKVWSDSYAHGAAIPARFAFGRPDAATHVTLSDNVSPHVAWSDLPAGTRSLALVLVDIDVPSVGTDVNQQGRTVPASLPRVPFYHWLVAHIAPTRTGFAEGEACRGVTPRGKAGPGGGDGMLHGQNDYTGWFAGDPDMAGTYFGYDGPCPPWNDERIHRYQLTVYALDVDRLDLAGAFTGDRLLAAIAGHVLGSAGFEGTYTLNPALR